jgi:tetratricopeptide (TPR) repeat protein
MLIDLGTTPIAETLRALAGSRSSGDLQVQSGKAVKTIFFDHGRIVFAASNLKKDRLGEALVALGRITDDQYNQASALLGGERKRKFGEALVQAGIMDKTELGRSVARQVNRIALSVFPFAEGVATFDERRSAIPLEYMVSLSMHRLLHDGIQLMTSEPLVQAGLGHLDRRVQLAPVAPFAFGHDDATKEELEILEHAQRKVTLRRLAWETGGLSFARLRAAYALLASGLLVDADRAEDGMHPVIQMETGMFLLSALQRQPDPSAAEALRREVADELERSARLDREAWLKVSREAPRDELMKALEEKMERYHQLLEAAAEDAALKNDLEVILGRVSAMQRLARQTPAPEPPPPAAAVADAAAVTEAPSSPAGESSPPSGSGSSPTPATAPAVPGSPVSTGTFTGAAAIEHLLLEGEVRMTVSDYANAIKVYSRLVELAPRIADYRLKLAIAKASYPRTAKQAERDFVEALRLAPDSANLHYTFGMYYKAMKQRARAQAELQTALRLDRRHALARKELETLSPEGLDVVLNLKKLFR